jgi:hypothetical protein
MVYKVIGFNSSNDSQIEIWTEGINGIIGTAKDLLLDEGYQSVTVSKEKEFPGTFRGS